MTDTTTTLVVVVSQHLRSNRSQKIFISVGDLTSSSQLALHSAEAGSFGPAAAGKAYYEKLVKEGRDKIRRIGGTEGGFRMMGGDGSHDGLQDDKEARRIYPARLFSHTIDQAHSCPLDRHLRLAGDVANFPLQKASPSSFSRKIHSPRRVPCLTDNSSPSDYPEAYGWPLRLYKRRKFREFPPCRVKHSSSSSPPLRLHVPSLGDTSIVLLRVVVVPVNSLGREKARASSGGRDFVTVSMEIDVKPLSTTPPSRFRRLSLPGSRHWGFGLEFEEGGQLEGLVELWCWEGDPGVLTFGASKTRLSPLCLW
ncbi:hypothetical protein PM082_010185 [Marasmius tenuissimus]|nr:hypothetical protein PM082_010185 [Marasmius tenuissimus]